MSGEEVVDGINDIFRASDELIDIYKITDTFCKSKFSFLRDSC